jgi:hypothetical protein
MVAKNIVVATMEAEIRNSLINLINKTQMLGNKMTKLHKDLTEKGAEVDLNSLGEVQMTGLDIDVLCSKLETLKKSLGYIRSINTHD